jgi:hypothetical protein
MKRGDSEFREAKTEAEELSNSRRRTSSACDLSHNLSIRLNACRLRASPGRDLATQWENGQG